MQPAEDTNPPINPEREQVPPPVATSPLPATPEAIIDDVNNTTEPVENTIADQSADTQDPDSSAAIRWEATEYLHDEKTPRWYIGLAAVVVIAMLLAWFLLRSWTFTLLIPVMATALVVLARRPPAVIYYELAATDVVVDDKTMPYTDFKAFGLVERQDHHMINLIPVKRFGTEVTILFPEDMGEIIVDTLAARLPMIDIQPNAVDTIIRKLRM